MSIPTIDELELLPLTERCWFPDDNTVWYWMDFASCKGLPSDRLFYRVACRYSKNYVHLAGRGYGVKGDYGNGSIFVSPETFEQYRLQTLDALT